MRSHKLIASALAVILNLQCASLIIAQSRKDARNSEYPEWRTNTEKRTISLAELESPAVTKDAIPAIDRPRFVAVREAREWLSDDEPVIALEVNFVSRAYPMEIMVWHEVVNDQIGGVPVAITFCSVCHSAIVFNRKLDRRVLSFGISGFVHGANMIFYDRETESWWQQFTGEAVVGDLTGKRLSRLPAEIISFAEFASAYPNGEVLSRETGYVRDYGRNPHLKYDKLNGYPSHFRGRPDKRLVPMERVIGVEITGHTKAFPYRISRARHVIYDRVGGQEIVIFHAGGTLSALDEEDMKRSRDVGSTGVFNPTIDGRRLQFRYENGQFIDQETGSRWNVLGKAVSGPLQGRSVKRIPHGDYFAFAWLAFKPATEIFDQ
jgi:Protein of unknown function (DUF3179)